MANLNYHHVIRSRFPESQYCLMQEVSDAAGFNRSRSADYIAMGLWPSRGLEINGIEVKSYRNDWLSELKNHAKAENVFQYCDKFWLITTEENIAKPEEIPITWGWMEIKGERIKVRKEAPMLTPKPISKNFLAAMLKRASDKKGYILQSSISTKLDESFKQGMEQSKRTVTSTVRDHEELRRVVKEFQDASGVDIKNISRWNDDPKKIGEAVKFIAEGGAKNMEDSLERFKHVFESNVVHINKILDELKAATTIKQTS